MYSFYAPLVSRIVELSHYSTYPGRLLLPYVMLISVDCNVIIPPKELIRITLADSIPDTSGIYILAYMGEIVYIGLAQDSVYRALLYHQYKQDRLGQWMLSHDPAGT